LSFLPRIEARDKLRQVYDS